MNKINITYFKFNHLQNFLNSSTSSTSPSPLNTPSTKASISILFTSIPSSSSDGPGTNGGLQISKTLSQSTPQKNS
ncbi:hypothetical protein Hanom_Chr08g00749501 [Helianthus anomalus]